MDLRNDFPEVEIPDDKEETPIETDDEFTGGDDTWGDGDPNVDENPTETMDLRTNVNTIIGNLDSDTKIQGRNIILDGNTEVKGTFKVGSNNPKERRKVELEAGRITLYGEPDDNEKSPGYTTKISENIGAIDPETGLVDNVFMISREGEAYRHPTGQEIGKSEYTLTIGTSSLGFRVKREPTYWNDPNNPFEPGVDKFVLGVSDNVTRISSQTVFLGEQNVHLGIGGGDDISSIEIAEHIRENHIEAKYVQLSDIDWQDVSGGHVEAWIKFDRPFTSAPVVIASPYGNTTLAVRTRKNNEFLVRSIGGARVGFSYIAVGSK